jgi:hypothetical protein
MGLDDSSYNTVTFVDGWKWLWGALRCLDNFEQDIKGRLFLDLLNEPDSMGQRWEVADNRKAGKVPGETSYIRCTKFFCMLHWQCNTWTRVHYELI